MKSIVNKMNVFSKSTENTKLFLYSSTNKLFIKVINKYFCSVPSSISKRTEHLNINSITRFDPKKSFIDKPKEYKRQALMEEFYTFEQSIPVMKTNNTELSGIKLLRKLEREYTNHLRKDFKNLTELSKEKKLPRMGDIIEVEYYYSISSGKLNKIRGMCVRVKNRDNFKFTFNLFSNVKGFNVNLQLTFYSPIVKSVKIIKATSDRSGRQTLINYKHLSKIGHQGKLLLQGNSKIKVNDRKKIKEFIRNEVESDFISEMH